MTEPQVRGISTASTLFADLKGYAKKNHKRCYGRGYLGLWPDGAPLPCSCVTRALDPDKSKANKGKPYFRGIFDTSLVG